MIRMMSRTSRVSWMLPLLAVLLVAGMLLSVQTALASTGVIGSVDGAPPTYKGTRSCTAFPITSKIDGISGQATVNVSSVENFDGSLIVPPGGVLALLGHTTPVAHSAAAEILWEEVSV